MASVGSRGDSYDNAMAEALNSVYKAELIDRKVWSGLIEVMAETSKWVAWYNQERLHSAIGYRPPFEVRSEWINQPGVESAAAWETKKRSLYETRGLTKGLQRRTKVLRN